MMSSSSLLRFFCLSAISAASFTAAAQVPSSRISIDASAPQAAPQPVQARLGTDRNPQGDVISVNSQYLTYDGKPWLPVMGEFHFSRYPESEWEREILKMKAAGVDIVATYLIWIHHEEYEGKFDWSGQRDFRRFVQLCAKHGMYVYPRIGPWAHGEVRNGGLPDWVLKNSPTRQNNPIYLREVDAFYKQIGDQMKGLLWKNGGPIIGIQVENEYRATGEGEGSDHIRTLKQMAIEDGMDVPLYTVTGWDGASIPLDAVLPVFGGYPDAPWDSSPKALPPNEVYAFRFANRSAGNMGAIGGKGQSPASVYAGTPFLTAEVGDGIQDTYFRRPALSTDDVAAIAPVMLGSGVNMLGYYMFHGGRNPDGGAITLQESQRTGYPTDVPVKSYDFQAPLGEFGQPRESLRKLKLVHYFLQDFGDELAPMAPHAPSVQPSSPSDVSVPRVSARTNGDAGFVFFNNHVRDLAMPARSGFQVELHLPSGVVRVPEQPISLAADSFGIWPVNFKLGSATLRYSTAQLFKKQTVAGKTTYFFFAIPGVEPEFSWSEANAVRHAEGVLGERQDGTARTLLFSENKSAVLELADGSRVVLLPEAKAEQAWSSGQSAAPLLFTSADAFADEQGWTLDTYGDPNFAVDVLGAHQAPKVIGDIPVASKSVEGLFTSYRFALKPVALPVTVTQQQQAKPRGAFEMGPTLSWRAAIAMAPDEEEFAGAASWKLALPAVPEHSHVTDALLRVRYSGDVARLYQQGVLVDDNFWNGLPWEIGLRETSTGWRQASSAEIKVLPLPEKYPMYLEKSALLEFQHGVAASLQKVELIPRYELHLQLSEKR
ncbi:MAG: beta-galactosidase [Acidobacteriaceae bacterium]|nr:beta-galactosidase [Acidobacteriaceae bacterium]